MVIVLDSEEPLVVVRGAAARRVLEQVGQNALGEGAAGGGAAGGRASPAAPQDFAEAMRRVEAELYGAA